MQRISSINDHKKLDLQDINCLIVVGTSLRREVVGATQSVKDFCESVHRNNGKSFWINPQPPTKNIANYFDHQILMKSDDVFLEVFSNWKPKLKALRIGPRIPQEICRRRIKPHVDYSGLDRVRKSRKELEAQTRVRKRRINNMINWFIHQQHY
jgi:hypothetical protein